MNNLTQNYELILKELTTICSHMTSFKQIRQPKLSDFGVGGAESDRRVYVL
jgi:hypothetical protein